MKFNLRVVAIPLLAVGMILADVPADGAEDALREAKALFNQEEYDEARRILDRLPEKSRANGEALYYLGRLDLINADHLWHAGNRGEAIRVLESFLKKVPRDKQALFSLATRIVLSGTDYGRARQILDRCLHLKSETGTPTEAMVRWTLGLAWHLSGDGARAQREWLKVYELDKDFDRILKETPQLSELNHLHWIARGPRGRS